MFNFAGLRLKVCASVGINRVIRPFVLLIQCPHAHMANQGSNRRTALECLAKAAFAAQFKVSPAGRGTDAGKSSETHGASDQLSSYILLPPEYRTIEVLTDLIIPADESPGAREAGVSEFIDFMAASARGNPSAHARRPPMARLGGHEPAWCAFADMSLDEQNRLLTDISVAPSSAPTSNGPMRSFVRFGDTRSWAITRAELV